MKQCPHCGRSYTDDTLSFCLEDGSPLSTAPTQEKTLFAPGPPSFNPPPAVGTYPPSYAPPSDRSPVLVFALAGVAVILVAALIAGAIVFVYYNRLEKTKTTTSAEETKPPITSTEQTKPLTFGDGTRYEGGVRDGNPDGRGIMIFPNGDIYDGEFANGKRNGTGTFKFHDGTKYTGQFEDDFYNGHGTMTFPNGNVYDGQFRHGKYDGQAVFTFSDGAKYEGEFKNDVYNGHGVMTFANGDVYDGQFQNGKYNGQGRFIYHDGRRQEGFWVDGKLVSSS